MEGKAALFKRFADIDAWPICLDTQDTDEIVRGRPGTSRPGFGGINLEDISAPRCFEIERRLRAELDIPVFHDDQHGTAIVVLRRADERAALRVQVAGRGPDRGRRRRRGRHRDRDPAARGAGAAHVLVWDREGILAPGRRPPERRQARAGRADQPGRRHRRPARRAARARTCSSGSARRACSPADWIADMAPDPVVFALANPDPEVDVDAAQQLCAVLATGRSDYPNQINNVLAFPGVFRGLLDARAQRGDHRDAAVGRGRARRLRHRRAAQRRPTSSRPCSTPRSRRRSRPRCGRRPARRSRSTGITAWSSGSDRSAARPAVAARLVADA